MLLFAHSVSSLTVTVSLKKYSLLKLLAHSFFQIPTVMNPGFYAQRLTLNILRVLRKRKVIEKIVHFLQA